MSKELLTFLEGVEHPADELDLFKLRYRYSSWLTYDGGFENYCNAANLPSQSGGLRAIIEEKIGFNESNVGLDIAGGPNGQALRDLLKESILGNALLTNYQDRRRLVTRFNHRMSHVKGDLIEPSTWEKIIDWQQENASEGFALIMHRPGSPLQQLPSQFYRGAAGLAIDMLRPGGVFFSQVSISLLAGRVSLEEMCTDFRERPDVENVIFQSDGPFISGISGAVIIKANTAPPLAPKS